MMLKKVFSSQKGAIQAMPVLLIVAAVGMISFLLITSIAPFKGSMFDSLFSKPASHASASDPTEPMYLRRVDSGNPSNYTDAAGNVWTKDKAYVAGGFGFVGGDNYTGDKGDVISGSSDPKLYATSRYGTTFGYNFAVPNGHYLVTLKLAEVRLASCKLGARIFTVQAEGINVTKGNDTFGRVGCATVGDVDFNIDVSDGVLNLNFISQAGFAAVNGIEVKQLGSVTPSPSPVCTPAVCPQPTSLPGQSCIVNPSTNPCTCGTITCTLISTPTPVPATPNPFPTPPAISGSYVQVLSPNGGENLQIGQTVRIFWRSVGENAFYLGYSFGAGSLNNITSGTISGTPTNDPSIRYYDWTVNVGNILPGSTRQVKIDILAYPQNGNHNDQSDNFFTVVSP